MRQQKLIDYIVKFAGVFCQPRVEQKTSRHLDFGLFLSLLCANNRTERRRVAEIIISLARPRSFSTAHKFFVQTVKTFFLREKFKRSDLERRGEKSAKKRVRSRYSALLSHLLVLLAADAAGSDGERDRTLTIYTHGE